MMISLMIFSRLGRTWVGGPVVSAGRTGCMDVGVVQDIVSEVENFEARKGIV